MVFLVLCVFRIIVYQISCVWKVYVSALCIFRFDYYYYFLLYMYFSAPFKIIRLRVLFFFGLLSGLGLGLGLGVLSFRVHGGSGGLVPRGDRAVRFPFCWSVRCFTRPPWSFSHRWISGRLKKIPGVFPWAGIVAMEISGRVACNFLVYCSAFFQGVVLYVGFCYFLRLFLCCFVSWFLRVR